jgi:hypothetical protein
MQKEKHVNLAVLLYLLFLFAVTLYNLITDNDVLDYVYMFVIICSGLRLIMIGMVKEGN